MGNGVDFRIMAIALRVELNAANSDLAELRATNKRLNETIQHMVDQTIPLVPDESNPMWSRRIAIDELQVELAALREELAAHKYKSELYDEVWPKATGLGFMNITMALAEIPRLQQRLTAAEQRNAEDLRDAERYRFIRKQGEEQNFICLAETMEGMDAAIDDALKPTESGASE